MTECLIALSTVADSTTKLLNWQSKPINEFLITVDNGISGHAGVETAQALGMQVIITDHHLTTKPTIRRGSGQS